MKTTSDNTLEAMRVALRSVGISARADRVPPRLRDSLNDSFLNLVVALTNAYSARDADRTYTDRRHKLLKSILPYFFSIQNSPPLAKELPQFRLDELRHEIIRQLGDQQITLRFSGNTVESFILWVNTALQIAATLTGDISPHSPGRKLYPAANPAIPRQFVFRPIVLMSTLGPEFRYALIVEQMSRILHSAIDKYRNLPGDEIGEYCREKERALIDLISAERARRPDASPDIIMSDCVDEILTAPEQPAAITSIVPFELVRDRLQSENARLSRSCGSNIPNRIIERFIADLQLCIERQQVPNLRPGLDPESLREYIGSDMTRKAFIKVRDAEQYNAWIQQHPPSIIDISGQLHVSVCVGSTSTLCANSISVLEAYVVSRRAFKVWMEYEGSRTNCHDKKHHGRFCKDCAEQLIRTFTKNWFENILVPLLMLSEAGREPEFLRLTFLYTTAVFEATFRRKKLYAGDPANESVRHLELEASVLAPLFAHHTVRDGFIELVTALGSKQIAALAREFDGPMSKKVAQFILRSPTTVSRLMQAGRFTDFLALNAIPNRIMPETEVALLALEDRGLTVEQRAEFVKSRFTGKSLHRAFSFIAAAPETERDRLVREAAFASRNGLPFPPRSVPATPPSSSTPPVPMQKLSREERKRLYAEAKAREEAETAKAAEQPDVAVTSDTSDSIRSPKVRFEHARLTVRDLTRGDTDNLHVQAIISYALGDKEARTREEISALVSAGLKKHFSARGFGDALRWLEEHEIVVRNGITYTLNQPQETRNGTAKELLRRVQDITLPA